MSINENENNESSPVAHADEQANEQTDTQANTQIEEQTNTVPQAANVEFTNTQIDSQQITTNTLSMVPLSPKYRTINLLVSAFWGGLIIILIALLSSGWFFDLPEDAYTVALVAYAAISFITLWSLVHHWFADPLKKYALREHDLNFQSGLIYRRLVSQPLLRIQHIELKRGPLERKAGLATLQVFSAGGVSHTFYIPGLEYERAVELRQFILDHKDLASDV